MRQRYNVSAGQTPLSRGALEAISQQLVTPIYYPEYWEAELQAVSLLQKLFGAQSEPLLITGNATHGIEMAMLNLIEPGESLITVNAGVFGKVLSEVAALCGAQVEEFSLPYGQKVDLERFEDFIRHRPQAAAVALVHVETTTGCEYPAGEMTAIARKHGKWVIVDAVSSLGAQPVEVDRWGVDICISSSQKALNAPQGLALLAVSGRACEKIARRPKPLPGVCLDLRVWREYRQQGVKNMLELWRKGGDAQIEVSPAKVIHGPSPSATLVYGLLGSLRDILAEGLDNVFSRHRWASQAVRAGGRALGMQVLAEEEAAACCVTTLLLPARINELALRRMMLEEHGIALGGGPSELGLHAIRVGTMGQTAHRDVQMPVLQALGICLQALGHDCRPETAIEAAAEVFSRSDEKLWEVIR